MIIIDKQVPVYDELWRDNFRKSTEGILFGDLDMPNYEYRCLNCRRRFEVYLTFTEYGQKAISCPHCQSGNVQRRIGRVRVAHSDESRLENMADPSSLAGLEDDPKSLGRMMRQMSSQMGEDMGPEFNEVVGRLEKGQTPEQIEKELPDLGSGSGSGMGGMDEGGDLGEF
jgi:putative FmdB family regulatory protein